jgi:hypothetical protein
MWPKAEFKVENEFKELISEFDKIHQTIFTHFSGPQPKGGRVYFTTWQTILLVQRQHGFGSIYK